MSVTYGLARCQTSETSSSAPVGLLCFSEGEVCLKKLGEYFGMEAGYIWF